MAIARNKCREFINKQDDINYPYVLLIDAPAVVMAVSAADASA